MERQIAQVHGKEAQFLRCWGSTKLRRAIVVLSGGQDSTTCLYWAKEKYKHVHAITFDYNQRHRVEIESARKVADLAEVESWECLALGPILKGISPLISDSNLEQYKDYTSLPGGLEKTFVPMRNQLFLTIAANRAAFHGASDIITGVCEEDYGGYPDCRREFINYLTDSINLGLYGKILPKVNEVIQIKTPLMNLTKKATVELAMTFPGCYEALAYTHTAYDGAYPPIGHDHANLLRAKGFEQANIPDPLVLRAWRDGLMALPDASNYNKSTIFGWMQQAGLVE